MKKVILSIFVAVFPLAANAFNGKAKVGGIWYNIVTKAEKAEVTKPDVGNYSGIVRIPSTIIYEGVTCKVTAIGETAFAWGQMTSVFIPNTVTKIGPLAFRWCEKLTSVTIPESVEEIGSGAFDGCSALKTVKIPSKLKIIENGLFKQCYQLASIVIPDNVTIIEMYAFSGCRGLKSVKIGDKVEKIGMNAFHECKELPSIIIPNSVVEIDIAAFDECSRLTTVTLGSGVEKIGGSAFAKCGDLKDFYCNGVILPWTDNNPGIFVNSDVEYATLHVAESMIETCKISQPWSKFGKIVANPNAVAPKSTGNNQL